MKLRTTISPVILNLERKHRSLPSTKDLVSTTQLRVRFGTSLDSLKLWSNSAVKLVLRWNIVCPIMILVHGIYYIFIISSVSQDLVLFPRYLTYANYLVAYDVTYSHKLHLLPFIKNNRCLIRVNRIFNSALQISITQT